MSHDNRGTSRDIRERAMEQSRRDSYSHEGSRDRRERDRRCQEPMGSPSLHYDQPRRYQESYTGGSEVYPPSRGRSRSRSPQGSSILHEPVRQRSPIRSSTASGESRPPGVSVWESILGPRPESNPEQPSQLLTLAAFGDQPMTPNFKPDYNQPAYGTNVDAAKRHLFSESQQRKREVSPETWKRIADLGQPYDLQEEDRSSMVGQDKPGTQPLRYLSAKASAPFFAAALHDANMPVTFPTEEDITDKELGMANRAPEKRPPRPYVPVVRSLQNYIKKLRSTCNIPRLKWPANSFPAPPEADKEFFQPTEVPKACWRQMQEDAYSWCEPDKAPPAGVEGAASTSSQKSASSKPHKIFPWNESRDTELHDLEALARDGLRLANASIITFAHLLNGSLDPKRTMTIQAKRHTLFTMNDLVHVTAEQFARIAQRLALHRKLNVTRSLNVADQGKLMTMPMSSDIFGGKWPEMQAAESESRKKKAEKDKERKAAQSASAKQSFRNKRPDAPDNRRDSGNQSRFHQGKSAQGKPAQSKQSFQPNKDKKPDPRNDKKSGGGGRGGGRGGSRGGGGGRRR